MAVIKTQERTYEHSITSAQINSSIDKNRWLSIEALGSAFTAWSECTPKDQGKTRIEYWPEAGSVCRTPMPYPPVN